MVTYSNCESNVNTLTVIMLHVAYVAGLFDGEGMVGLHKRTGELFDPKVSISNTKPEVLHHLKQQYGGAVITQKARSERHSDSYEWRASSEVIKTFLADVLPYLIIKKEQAELMLQYLKEKRPHSNKGHSRKLSDEEKLRQYDYYLKFKALKGKATR